MKNVGILTFHKSINYGSVLQAFALQKMVNKLGYASEIIDYEPKNYPYMYAAFRPIHSFDDLKYNVGNVKYLPVIKKKEKMFLAFRKEHLSLSKQQYFYGQSIETVNDRYQTLVCGSDQIWNPKSRDFDTNFFFPFKHSAKKVSYAVSLNDGSLSSLPNVDEYKQYMEDFDAISVREEDAKIKLQKMVSNNIVVTLDPTLLHSSDEYEEICSKRVIEAPYIFFYSIGYSEAAVEAANILAERTGLRVFVLHTGRGVKRVLRNNKDIQLVKNNVSPCDFISLIKHADYVVTDSFHGTAFSIIYHKRFFSIASVSETREKKADFRIHNILEKLCLLDQYVSPAEIKKVDLTQKPDFEKCDKNKVELQKEAIEYMSKSL